MGVFDSKIFNSEVFARYMETVPRVKQNALLEAGVIRPRNDLKALFAEQSGGNFATVPMYGRIGGTALNYDGTTNITAGKMDTFQQSMIVVGRMMAWEEKDFSKDITGADFMAQIARQTADYWDDVDQQTILSTLKGVFLATTNANGFAAKHTLDISGSSASSVSATSLNDVITQAAGANKGIFSAAIMHSVVANTLENLNLLEYRKYTDNQGIQREIAIADWNGRTVLVDDGVPTETAENATKYTTYILGEGAFGYVDCGAATPVETYRDATRAGGVDMLINRQRKIFAPAGFSFVQPSTAIMSPSDEQLETGARWAMVKNAAGNAYYDDRAIPIARIISKG